LCLIRSWVGIKRIRMFKGGVGIMVKIINEYNLF
jgi:hypothetical protein